MLLMRWHAAWVLAMATGAGFTEESVPPQPKPVAPADQSSSKDIETAVLSATRKQLQRLKVDPAKITLTSRLKDLGADDLDRAEIMFALEKKFGTEFPEEAEGKISSVQEMVDFLKLVIATKKVPKESKK